MSKSVLGQQSCRTLTFALARLSFNHVFALAREIIALTVVQTFVTAKLKPSLLSVFATSVIHGIQLTLYIITYIGVGPTSQGLGAAVP